VISEPGRKTLFMVVLASGRAGGTLAPREEYGRAGETPTPQEETGRKVLVHCGAGVPPAFWEEQAGRLHHKKKTEQQSRRWHLKKELLGRTLFIVV
jgi:hypothetical protein